MRELILGGEGLLGSALSGELKARGHEVGTLDLKSGCDLRHADISRHLSACDRAWFLAWDVGGVKYLDSPDEQHEQFKHNCALALNVFDALARAGRPFLFTSSQLSGAPNAYGVTKRMAEVWAGRLGGKVARLWNVFGWERPGARSHVVPDLVLSGLQRGLVECMTDGGERRRFLYKTDGAEALLGLFDGPSRTADIAGPEWVSVRQLAEEVARQLNVKVRFGGAKGSEHIVEPSNSPPGWSPRVSLREGLARVIRDAREHLGAGA